MITSVLFDVNHYMFNHIGDVMISVLASSTVDREFEPWSGQTNDYQNNICCFSAKHTVLRRKSKEWLALNHDKWSDTSTRGLLF